MNDDEENTVVVFGTPLDPLEEDELPSKKPIQVQDQKVYDENGLQRFHGAFTGGFSAGYFNTVGTKEGWAPSEFVSSRSQKAERNIRRPEDFMDAEDLREFGIAPKRIQTKENFRNENRQLPRPIERTAQVIPGTAPLLDIVKPVSNSIGVTLLKKLGWRPGKGVGPKKQLFNQQDKVYGCSLPPGGSEQVFLSSTLVSPSDVNVLLYETKNNVYGLGYTSLKDSDISVSSLVADSVFGHVKMGNSKRKVAFRGQAFGVGAFEDDDDDIYVKDDLSSYDFALEDEKVYVRKQEPTRQSKSSFFGETCVKGFVNSSNELSFRKKHFPPPDLPPGYTPKSLTPISTTPLQNIGTGRFLNRFAFCAVDRTKILGSRFEDSVNKPKDHKKQHPLAQRNAEPEKYSKTVEITPQKSDEIVQNTKPVTPKLKYQTVLSTKFVTSSVLETEELSYGLSRPSVSTPVSVADSSKKLTKKEHKCQRLIEEWHPFPLLCKRFNVPNPYPDSETVSMTAIAAKKSSFKHSIFRSLFEIPATPEVTDVADKSPPSPYDTKAPEDSQAETEFISKDVHKISTPTPPITKEILEESLPSLHDFKEREATRTDNDFATEVHKGIATHENQSTEDSSSRLQTNEEDYSPPTPPTMDLFNEIFNDTSDESSAHSEEEDDKEESKDPIEKTEKDDATPVETVNSDEPASSSTTEPPVTSILYGPALPPANVTPVIPQASFTFVKSSGLSVSSKTSDRDVKHSRHKSKKRKAHHKSHKKHKKKKMKRSKVSSDDNSSDKSVDTEPDSDDEGDYDVNYRLIKRLKQMKKSK